MIYKYCVNNIICIYIIRICKKSGYKHLLLLPTSYGYSYRCMVRHIPIYTSILTIIITVICAQHNRSEIYVDGIHLTYIRHNILYIFIHVKYTLYSYNI